MENGTIVFIGILQWAIHGGCLMLTLGVSRYTSPALGAYVELPARRGDVGIADAMHGAKQCLEHLLTDRARTDRYS